MNKLKNPKSIVISFRLSPAVVAKAIDGLKHYDKSSDITKLSTIIKQTTLHGINYMTSALPFEPSAESQMIVHHLTTQGKKGQGSLLEQSILGQPVKVIEKEYTKQSPKEAPSYFDIKAAEESASIKSNVTDFSMPKKLMDELEEEE